MGIDQATAYAQSRRGPRDHVHFWREGRYDDLECLRARFFRHSYAPHVHDTFAIGVILEGAEAFRCRGTRHIAPAGALVAVNPDELHDGEPCGEGYAYRMFYPSVRLVRSLAEELKDRPMAFPAFPRPVISDRTLAARFSRVHGLMEARATRLAVDEALTAALSSLLARHCVLELRPRRPARERGPVARVRAAIDARYMDDLGLDELARIAGLSRYYLLRCFRREVGITPQGYQTGRRIAAAKRLLQGSMALSEIALRCGFYDQSHLTRAFKSWTGVTPGRYRAGLAPLHH